MKNFHRSLLTGIIAFIVVAGTAASVYYRNRAPTLADAKEKSGQLAEQRMAKVEKSPEIKTLLQKMNLSVNADHPTVPDFELLDLEGKTVHLSQFKGETVLLGFFTTW